MTRNTPRALARAGFVLLASMVCGACVLTPRAAFPSRAPTELPSDGRAVAVVGDLQMTSWFVRTLMRREFNRDEQAVLIADLEQRGDELAALVVVGDLVYNAASRRDWAHFDALLAGIVGRVPVLPALGNHDYYCLFIHWCTQRVVPKSARLRFPWLAPGRPYFVAFGDTVLVFFDSETALAAQGAWLSAMRPEFEARFAAIVVFTHRPPYSDSTARGLEPDTDVQDHVVAALDGSTLTPLVVSGHAHGYERLLIDGTTFVVSGGGGGPRSSLAETRPWDAYAGRDCRSDSGKPTLRPFNYLLVTADSTSLQVEVRGLCKGEAQASVIERFVVPFRQSASRATSSSRLHRQKSALKASE